MQLLVTGSEGFLGKNLLAQLKNEGFNDIKTHNSSNTDKELESSVKSADFIFHLAGVNRTQNTDDFYKGNGTLTKEIVAILEKNNLKTPILLSSSIQAGLENDYGKSKKEAETTVFEYSNNTGTKVHVYRLKNLFGKWSKPNYNSVVATFCYNLSRNIPLQVNDPSAELDLCYVDDVIASFLSSLKDDSKREGKYSIVKTSYQITLGKLSEKLQDFHDNRETLVMPSLKEQFDRDLYATYLSYLPENEFSYFLKKNTDDRGWLSEFIKSKDNGQIFISTTKPGITRGNHWHNTKVEKFLVIRGSGRLQFRNVNNDEIIEYFVDGEKPEVVDIPAGYTHNISNVGTNEMITLFWASEIFDQKKPDTYYEGV